MLTADDIKLHTFYGENPNMPRVMAYTWEDGPEGVNYEIEGVMTIDAIFTDKATFLAMANHGPAAALAFGAIDYNQRGIVKPGTVINPEAQTDEQRDFLAAVRRMKD